MERREFLTVAAMGLVATQLPSAEAKPTKIIIDRDKVVADLDAWDAYDADEKLWAGLPKAYAVSYRLTPGTLNTSTPITS